MQGPYHSPRLQRSLKQDWLCVWRLWGVFEAWWHVKKSEAPHWSPEDTSLTAYGCYLTLWIGMRPPRKIRLKRREVPKPYNTSLLISRVSVDKPVNRMCNSGQGDGQKTAWVTKAKKDSISKKMAWPIVFNTSKRPSKVYSKGLLDLATWRSWGN